MLKKPIPGYEGLYEASEDGHIWSLWRPGARGPRAIQKEPRMLRESKTTTGYYTVALCKDGVARRHQVHSLMALAFIGKRERFSVVDHVDANPLNNSLSNLRIISHSKNLFRSEKHWSKTGFRGVARKKNPGGSVSWFSYVTINKKRILVGTFGTPLEAHNARLELVKRLDQ